MTTLPQTFADTGIFVRGTGRTITRFQVVGERSSGTNYVKRLFGRNSGLTPTEAMGWKHGAPRVLAIPYDLLVIVVVRNAADWARGMHSRPWHANAAMQALAFSDFIRHPWESIIDRPRYFGIEQGDKLVGQPLQPDRDPFTGLAYPNLFALREGKLIQHLSLLNRGCAVAMLRLEKAQEEPQDVVDTVLDRLDLSPRAEPFRPVIKRLGTRFKPAVEPRPDTPETLCEDDLAYLRAQVDSDFEAALGYSYDTPAETVHLSEV